MATIAHQSGRWDRTADTVEASLAALVASDQALDLITLTEMGQKHVSTLAPDGWATIQANGPGRGECAILYKPTVWRVLRSWPMLLSPANPDIGSMWARDQYVPVALLEHRPTGERLWVVVVHMPAHVEAVWSKLPRVVRHYHQCLSVLAAFRRAKSPVLIIGDWNLDARKPWVRVLLRARLGLRGIIAPREGTHGPRVIDFAVCSRSVAKVAGRPVVSAHKASDHKRIRFRLRMKGLGS